MRGKHVLRIWSHVFLFGARTHYNWHSVRDWFGGFVVVGLEDSLAVIEGCAVTYVVELCVLPNGFAPWGLGTKTCPGMRHLQTFVGKWF